MRYVELSLITGASVYESVFVIVNLLIDWSLYRIIELYKIIFVGLSFIYAITVLIYLFNNKKVCFIMKPIRIFGLLQAIIINIYYLVYLIHFCRSSESFKKSEIILLALVSGSISIEKITKLYNLMNRDHVLSVSLTEENNC